MTVNCVCFKIHNPILAEIVRKTGIDLAVDGDIVYSNRKGNPTERWLEIGSEGFVEEKVAKDNVAAWLVDFLGFMGDVFCGGFSSLSDDNVNKAQNAIEEDASGINKANQVFEIKICCCSDEGFDNSFEIYNFADDKLKSICISEWDYTKYFPDDDRPFWEIIMDEGPDGVEELIAYKKSTSFTKKESNNKDIKNFVIENGELKQYVGKGGNVVIPNGVTYIGYQAFWGCEKLTSITIPDSVTSIGGCAFYGCSSLTSITIPDSITSIGNSAFMHCKSLTSITIPDSVTKIGGEAFSHCEGLADNEGFVIVRDVLYGYFGSDTSITIPNSVTYIETKAFYGCTSLTSITIPENVTFIGFEAFRKCENLTNITIPDSVTSIVWGAFVSCPKLKTVYFNSEEQMKKFASNFSSKKVNTLIIDSVISGEDK